MQIEDQTRTNVRPDARLSADQIRERLRRLLMHLGPEWASEVTVDSRNSIDVFIRRTPRQRAARPGLWHFTVTAEDQTADAFEVRLRHVARQIEDETRVRLVSAPVRVAEQGLKRYAWINVTSREARFLLTVVRMEHNFLIDEEDATRESLAKRLEAVCASGRPSLRLEGDEPGFLAKILRDRFFFITQAELAARKKLSARFYMLAAERSEKRKGQRDRTRPSAPELGEHHSDEDGG
jgi:hypothetical protein